MTTHTINTHLMGLQSALRALHEQNGSMLAYEQCIDVRDIDPGFAPLTRYQIETLRLQFPPEAVRVRNFRSSSPCKIVAYQQLGPMIEMEVRPGMEIAILPETVCLIYTRSKRDFRVWFELILRKRQTGQTGQTGQTEHAGVLGTFLKSTL